MPFIDHFDVLAPVYDHFIAPSDASSLISYLNLPIEGIILDAGGGTGRISQYLVGLASKLVIVDLSFKMLRQAAAKERLAPVCSPCESLPFPPESFERVIMVDALHHVKNQGVTTRELWRVVKPGGIIVIQEPDIRLLEIKLVALGEKIALMRSHFISPINIQKLFTYPNATVNIKLEGYNACVIVEKTGP